MGKYVKEAGELLELIGGKANIAAVSHCVTRMRFVLQGCGGICGEEKQSLIQRLIAALAEIFAPLIPAIITGGLILGFRNCIDSMYLFENGTKTLCDISPFWRGADSFSMPTLLRLRRQQTFRSGISDL